MAVAIYFMAISEDEKRILRQRELGETLNTAKSNMLFLDRYNELMKPGAEMLIVLDDTILNGKSCLTVREWIVDKFVLFGGVIHCLLMLFKANANVKTSILHLRKKIDVLDEQGHIFVSISNNVGHDNALKDTRERNENLECPEQARVLPPDELLIDRFDSFFFTRQNSEKYLQSLRSTKNKAIYLYTKEVT